MHHGEKNKDWKRDTQNACVWKKTLQGPKDLLQYDFFSINYILNWTEKFKMITIKDTLCPKVFNAICYFMMVTYLWGV